MKVFVFGGGGDVGEYVLKKLAAENHEATTVAETENRAEELKMMGAVQVMVATDHQFVDAMVGCRAIIYIAGANPTAGENKNVLVDKDAVANAMAEARKQGIERVVYLSPARVDESAESQETGGKKGPEELIKLDVFTYTVVHSTRGVHKPGKGMIDIVSSNGEKGKEIPFEDVAAVLVESLANKATYNKTFKVVSGTTPIKKALANL
ncbi:NAD-dependent epimerase/dehydratase [Planococcus antarcticus DSM 14505]|uniref:NAD-dependent epimerase n=1 Tax=Planococcus antarcticus DSM 14505 TaxID=1185653 RepID=A0A1C7DKJ0_9BACL|nr:NAD(P)H-binding protein [Planococcus antarcticus]ANU11937.1 NAD-dependent epimerase [Planococcus antarcticus DSM 14505]EIM05973.1 NAD-dependent epimerase/dehydratase [Planococcus antarcticus DSM 14505]